jgi:hypothetical protein
LSHTDTQVDREPLSRVKRLNGDAPVERHTEPAVANALMTAAGKMGAPEESRWRLQIDAPRWAIVRDGHDAKLATWLFVAALVWAALGIVFAWHLSDQLASHRRLVPPLSEQIGLWVAVLVVIGGAVAAGITAFRSAKLHVNMALEPSAKAEAERREELHDRLVAFFDKQQAPADPMAISAGVAAASALTHNGKDQNGASDANAPTSESTSQSGSSDSAPSVPAGQPEVKTADPRTTLSPKVAAGGATALASAAFWTVAAATFWHRVEPTVLAALGTGLTAVTTAIAAWWKTDPLRIARIIQSRPAK